MRFDSLAFGPADQPTTIRFHEHVTVVSGLDPTDRSALTDLILGSLDGTAPEIRSVKLVDATGRRFERSWDGGGTGWVDEQGAASLSPTDLLGLSGTNLRRLVVLRPTDLGILPATASNDPELVEARASLAELETELAQALTVKASAEQYRARVAEFDEQLRDARDGVARRDFARLLARIEQLRIELDTLRNGAAMEADDRRFLTESTDVGALIVEWRNAAQRVATDLATFDDRPRLDPDQLLNALAIPEHPPQGLDRLVSAYDAARTQRARLQERLAALTTDHVAEPSNPVISRWAHIDQDRLWEAAHRAVDASVQLEELSLAATGAGAGKVVGAASELEAAHHRVEGLERKKDERLKPGIAAIVFGLGTIGIGLAMAVAGLFTSPMLVLCGALVVIASGLWAIGAPRRDLASARKREEAALKRVGARSYGSWLLRRVDVAVNPSAGNPLTVAAATHERALADWQHLAGEGVAPLDALGLEDECRTYSAILGDRRSAGDPLGRLRNQLITEIEPAVESVRGQLLQACKQFGVADPSRAVDGVKAGIERGRAARIQARVEQGEQALSLVSGRLNERLSRLGLAENELGIRVQRFEAMLRDTTLRQQARTSGRSVDQVGAELRGLETRAAAERRPEWGDIVEPSDAPEPDTTMLERARNEAASMAETTRRSVPDINRLRGRQEAMARRVEVLTRELEAAPRVNMSDVDQLLLARLTSARRVGPHAETLPVVLDDPFDAIHGDGKWRLLEEVERLAASVQLIYLTDDPETIVWSRKRAALGAIMALEPAAASPNEPTDASRL